MTNATNDLDIHSAFDNRSEGTFYSTSTHQTKIGQKHNFSVNRDKLEGILASQKTMQNYEDALWGFEKTLNKEVDDNRL